MNIIRNAIKCNVCGKVTLIRMRESFLDYHPIRYNCANCGTLIKGTYKQKKLSISLNFENGTRIEEANSDYYLEVSGELITEKVTKIINQMDMKMIMRPFEKIISIIGKDKYEYIFKNSRSIVLMDNEWQRLMPLEQLYLNKKDESLVAELSSLLPNCYFSSNNKLELLCGIYKVFSRFLNPIFSEKFSNSIQLEIYHEIKKMHNKDTESFKKLVYYFEKSNTLSHLEKKAYELLNEFFKVKRLILPVINIFYSNKCTINDVKKHFDITTCSFNEIKQFYINSYEQITEMLCLPIAYNNLKCRNSFDNFVDKNGQSITIEKFLQLPTWEKLQYFSDKNIFNCMNYTIFDNSVFNAILHNEFEYDGKKQEISIHNSNKVIIKRIYLIEFAYLCYEMFQFIIKLQKFIFITKKYYYLFEGFEAVNQYEISSDCKIRKVGRNDLCPCGSGKKYKNCCDKVLKAKTEESLIKKSDKILIESNFVYWVVVNTDISQEQFRNKSIKEILGFENEVHLFDKQYEKILPAIWYCLQMPRSKYDVLDDVNIKYVDKKDTVSHSIKIIHSCNFKEVMMNLIEGKMNPTLVICEDNCYKEVNEIFKNNSELGVISVSSLSTDLLNSQWNKIANHIKNKFSYDVTRMKRKLFIGDERRVIPILFMLNRLPIRDGYYDKLLNFNSQEELFFARINIREFLNNIFNLTEEKKKKLQYENTDGFDITRNCTFKKMNSRQLPIVEKDVIRLIGTHNAIHNNAAMWEFEKIPNELFEELNQLELHCKDSTKRKDNNKFIWRKLSKIGKILTKHIGEEGLKTIQIASRIIAFTNFPIGLAILPNTSAPMMCYTPITYKPLTPLTRLLKYQLNDQSQCCYDKKCRILIAECIPEEEDEIKKKTRNASILSWKKIIECFKDSKLEIVYFEIKNVESLKRTLEDYSDIDILVISAHGNYDKKKRKTELQIGEDMWSAEDDIIQLPPVVILSSCHVSPRGLGSVNVADSMLMLGAKVVVGTLVPILVDRNAILLTRLFTYINEALNGNKQFRTFLDAWTWVVASNAVHEIVDSSRRLKNWINEPNSSGCIPIEEFQNRANKKQLDLRNVYSDTISILRELAENDGILDELDGVINSKSYFPESVFYQLIGDAEDVFLYPD